MSNFPELTQRWAEQRDIPIHFQPETGSTNDNAKVHASQEDDELCLYLTAHQTAGRGRGTHHWLDTGSGESLLSTWSLATPQPPQAISGPRVGLALFQAASRTWPSLNWGLKAPNDLFLGGRKVAGLLLESVSSGARHRLLVGLGLNVSNHPRSFATATHLAEILGHLPEEAEWFQFLDEWNNQLQAAVVDCQKPVLSGKACQQIKEALNANSTRPFEVVEVTPSGDLMHPQGRVKWMEI